nr:PREDICTED: activin receptor type-2A-like [Bemisia tabaci]XP_018896084.1 PREDICTED: activin receptor type-2A-like [Bemisia tabaci]XP_018896085.1 PREDICTED: activin receptor type-2A-like [Bemisia tabaci]
MILKFGGFLLLLLFTEIVASDVILCETYTKSECEEPSYSDCNKTLECEPAPRTYCFVAWTNVSGVIDISHKGCFHYDEGGEHKCVNQTKCVDKSEEKKKQKFCCCEGSLCNNLFSWELEVPKPIMTAVTQGQGDNSIILYTLVPIFVLCVSLGLLYLAFHKKKLPYFSQLPTLEPQERPPSPNLGFRPIELIEMKARGRFGCVWKAQYKTDIVAVKIFSPQDKQLWQTEQEIFKLNHMDHENILHYIGAEKHGDNLHAEFWLITTFHEQGSLHDFLKANIVTWQQLCRIAHSMSRGLSHLHEEIPANKTSGHKPSVAHRDFKSSNVLLKSDLTACIADFDLALIFEPGKSCGDVHGQVGTRRYWAPEVLEGAINFSHDAFLRIDVYAMGLVLWELVSRCVIHQKETESENENSQSYQLPYEAEVGSHPSLEDMQECVVYKKQRPAIPESWREHKGMALLCDTMEECWDHDAEARLSAPCVMERIVQYAQFSGVNDEIYSKLL